MLSNGATSAWDDTSSTPYLQNGNQWFTYDDAKSVTDKVSPTRVFNCVIEIFQCNFASSKSLGGVFVWTLDEDDFSGACGSKYPLLSAIKTAIQ